jgi:hypothetical protein
LQLKQFAELSIGARILKKLRDYYPYSLVCVLRHWLLDPPLALARSSRHYLFHHLFHSFCLDCYSLLLEHYLAQHYLLSLAQRKSLFLPSLQPQPQPQP